jgi:hypothetical protein
VRIAPIAPREWPTKSDRGILRRSSDGASWSPGNAHRTADRPKRRRSHANYSIGEEVLDELDTDADLTNQILEVTLEDSEAGIQIERYNYPAY